MILLYLEHAYIYELAVIAKHTMRQSIILILIIASQTLAVAQSKSVKERIFNVENGFSVNTDKGDSTVIKYNIIDRMTFYKVPSVSITVIDNYKISWSKSYGYADISEKRLSDVNTVYQAASISKSLNALCVMRLYQKNQLSLERDIRNYLKTWTFPDNEFSRDSTITIANLLNHTAGLSTSGFAGYARNDTLPTINDILDAKSPANSEAVRPVFPPNTKAQYSGGGITVVRKILEDNINPNYTILMQNTILKPLKMNKSSFAQPLKSSWKNFATAYDADSKEIAGKYNVYPELAPDGLWSTSNDIAKFVIGIQNSLNNEPSIIRKETAEKMLTPGLTDLNMALGFFILQFGDEKYFSHTGRNLGYTCIYIAGFSNGKGVVILTNSENGEALYNEILTSVAAVYNWEGFTKKGKATNR